MIESFLYQNEIHDAIGIRMVTGFVDDIYLCAGWIRNLPGCRVISEKDYIRNAKKNGYRSYHILLETEVPWPDIEGRTPGQFYAEVQIRTIAMDSWASLEHRLHYKKNIANAELITAELKRCADELAACDLSMQTIRKLIEESAEEEIMRILLAEDEKDLSRALSAVLGHDILKGELPWQTNA
jgi:ppGpp synthetase/RelA/SpoT-type nucleotidyltranferase